MTENTDSSYPVSGNSPKLVSSAPKQPSIIIHNHMKGKSFWVKFLIFALVLSVIFNFSLVAQYEEYFSNDSGPIEKYHSGDKESKNKIAIISVNGTIMPPYTARIIKSIKQAGKDSKVKGVVLSIDSPGGMVADSHQIYHELELLKEKKPIHVVMKRIAASGGLYVAMGAGPEAKIFAEPTCWTGSIGVIIPRFDFSGLAEKYGVASDPLKTGEFKDALNPFRKMKDNERKLWEEIIDDSFQRFINLIADNRSELDYEAVKKLATGQVYTATQAKENHLIDEIGYEVDVIASLKQSLNLEKVRVISYEHLPSFMEILGSSETSKMQSQWKSLMEATVPQAMYYFSWLPVIPGSAEL
jgi:protease IV